jgi:hypothetical protein
MSVLPVLKFCGFDGIISSCLCLGFIISILIMLLYN